MTKATKSERALERLARITLAALDSDEESCRRRIREIEEEFATRH
jgi:hypothetical protein